MLPSEIVNQLQQVLPARRRHAGGVPTANAIAFPVGYRWEFGGEKFEQDKGFKSLTIALVVSFVAIYLALVAPVQLGDAAAARLRGGAVRSRRRPDRPGSSSARPSASWRSSASRRSPGLIISHVIVLFDFIDEMRHKGEPLRKAVVDAGLARLRPVARDRARVRRRPDPAGAWRAARSGSRCATSRSSGMLVATLVTLVIVPVLYVIFVEDLHLVRWETDSAAPFEAADKLLERNVAHVHSN